jgi:ATP phosphoribosyltransferase regulatory subunit HisZ
LGVPGEPGEREVLRLFLDAVSASGSKGKIQVVLGLAGCLDRLLLGCDAADGSADPAALASSLARRDRSEVRRHCPQLLPIAETGLPEHPEDLGEAEGRRLRGLLALRDQMAGLFPDVDLFLDLAEFARHGLDPRLTAEQGDRSYYDGLVFRAFAGPSALPVGGGGRYDRMFRALGAEVAAAGFSVSVDRLLEAVP